MAVKDVSLETLRGVACLLLVFNHLIGAPFISGLKLPEGNGYYEFNLFFENLRMPLFAFLGGYVFAIRGVDKATRGVLITGKIKRLMYPLIFVGIPYLIIKKHSGLANNSAGVNLSILPDDLYFLSVVFESQAHFWFLQAMLLVFFCYAIMKSFINKEKTIAVFMLILFIPLSFVVPIDISFFSTSGFVYLMPYFSFGVIVLNFKDVILKNRKLIVLLITPFVFSIFYYKFFLILASDNFERISLLAYALSFSSLMLLYCFKFRNRVLAYIGNYSFAIYLYHIFFLAASRKLLSYCGIDNVVINIIVGISFTIAMSILAQKVLTKNYYLSWPFLGQKPSFR